MNTKPRIKESEFISIFLVMFFPFLFISLAATSLASVSLGGFPTRSLMNTIILSLTVVGTVISMIILRWKNDTSGLPIVKTVLKLIGVIGFLPLIAYGPVLLMRHNIGDLFGVLQILVWLIVIGCVTIIMLKSKMIHLN